MSDVRLLAEWVPEFAEQLDKIDFNAYLSSKVGESNV